MEVNNTLRARLELKALREQVARMAEQHREKKSVDFQAAHFAASMHLTELSSLLEKMALEASQGRSSDFCAVPGCGCSESG